MKSLECLTARCLLAIYWLVGLLPFPLRFDMLPLIVFASIMRCLWTMYFLAMLWNGYGYLKQTCNLSISYISGSALYIGYAMLGLLLQLESTLKHRAYERLKDMRMQSQLQMQRLGMSRGCPRAMRLLILIGIQVATDMAKIWANTYVVVSPVLFATMPQMWLLRFRYMQLLEQVMELNQRARQLRHSLLSLATGNDIWQPFGLHDDRQLQTLRISYDCIFECYESFSDCYGWGMLGLQVMCSFEFVSNAYWMIIEAYQDRDLFHFIYNGASCLGMGTLIIALFWYGDASTENAHVLVSVIMFSSLAARARAEQIFQFLGFFFGVRWSSHRIHRLQLVQLCGWFAWYALIYWHALCSLSTRVSECKLDCLIAHTLFLMLTWSHIIILLEAFLQRRTFYPLAVLAQDRQASKHLSVCIYSVLLPNLILHITVIVISFKLERELSMPLFWFATPSSFGLQMKLYMFLSDILVANVRVMAVRECIKELARKPLIHSTPWRQQVDAAIESVKCIKQRYSQLSQIFVQINVNYGHSLLIIFIALFFNFVCNAYWLVSNVLARSNYSKMNIIHLSVVICLGALFATICWHCQQSYNHSRQIGCLISKLVKPAGGKRYNDLICEFLLQTLHQRFVVTAKDFFSLNLHLLSSMFAAVVTYLVILIQFMFAEKGSQQVEKLDKSIQG